MAPVYTIFPTWRQNQMLQADRWFQDSSSTRVCANTVDWERWHATESPSVEREYKQENGRKRAGIL